MKYRFLVLLTIAILFALGHTNSLAQTRLGGALAFASKYDFGLQFNSEFFVSDNISVAPDFTLYFPGNSQNFWAINANGHYYFMEPSSGVYGIAGLQIAHESIDISGFGNFSSTELGLNLGGGYGHDLGSWMPFGMLMITVGKFDQFVIGGGARFNIGG